MNEKTREEEITRTGDVSKRESAREGERERERMGDGSERETAREGEIMRTRFSLSPRIPLRACSCHTSALFAKFAVLHVSLHKYKKCLNISWEDDIHDK